MRSLGHHLQTAACAAVCLLFLAGCGSAPRDLLWYQDSLISATLSREETVCRLCPTEDGYTVEILAPASLSGIQFTVNEAGAFVSSGSVTLPAQGRMRTLPDAAAALFRLDPAFLSELRVENGVTSAVFEQPSSVYTVRIGAEGLPLSFLSESADGTVLWQVSEIITGPTDGTHQNQR